MQQLSKDDMDHCETMAAQAYWQDMLTDEERTKFLERMSRFFLRTAELGPADARVGDVLTEADLRRIWEQTSDSQKESA